VGLVLRSLSESLYSTSPQSLLANHFLTAKE